VRENKLDQRSGLTFNIYYMVVCIYCNKEFKSKYNYHSNRNLNRHIIHCIDNPNRVDYKCKYCELIENTPCKIATHTSVCKFNPDYDKIINSKVESGKIGRPHTQETKDKISKHRKEYLRNNPDKVPYLLNHSRNESYPEKYFTELFKNEGIDVIKSHRIKLYELDFSITNKKIDIEIDGSQHYYDKRIVESDKRRTKFLEDNGWDIIRIDWRNYQKLDKSEKEVFIKEIKMYINSICKIKPHIEVIDRYKCSCGGHKYKTSKMCNKCRGEKDRKVKRPSYEQILKDISEFGYRTTGRKYGVSDNAVRKWLKNYNNNEQ